MNMSVERQECRKSLCYIILHNERRKIYAIDIDIIGKDLFIH